MRTKVLISLQILFLVGLGALGFFLYQKKTEIKKSETLVGADRDEHGCIGSAGYSWCEIKQKCLRGWEEACLENPVEEIKALLATKYQKTLEEVDVKITKQEEGFAAGSVNISGGGGLFLAKKTDGKWQLVYDGNGSVDCVKLRETDGFPDSILKPNFCD